MRKLILCFVVVMAWIVTGCHENIDVFLPTNSSQSPLEDGVIDRLFSDLDPEVSTIELNAAEAAVWTSSHGLSLNIPANAFMSMDGEMVEEGVIELNLVELLSAGQMIIHDKPNVASGVVLEAAGNLYLEATSDDLPLQLAPGKLIEVRLPGVSVESGLSSSMELFWGNNQNPAFFNWEPFDNEELTVQLVEYFDSLAMEDYQAYQFVTDRMGWIGCGAPVPENVPVTTLCVDLPNGFVSANTAVYAVFQNFKGAVKLFNDEAVASNTFCIGKLPTATDVLIVVLTEAGDDNYYFGNSLIHMDRSQMSVDVFPEMTSLEAIRSFLNEL